jgi:hypothetical protein
MTFDPRFRAPPRRRPSAAIRHAWTKAMGTAFVRLLLILLATLAAYLHQRQPLEKVLDASAFSAGTDESDLNHDHAESLDMDNDGAPEL